MTRPLTLRPDELTARQAAIAAGVDDMVFVRLLRQGVLPSRRVHGASRGRGDGRGVYAVRRAALWAWVQTPDAWLIIHTPTDPLLRHLVDRAQRASSARWWMTGEIAARLYVTRFTVANWRAVGWPTGGRWVRVNGGRGLLWWDKTTPPTPPTPQWRNQYGPCAAD
jgi:hypothetical protein